MATHNELGLQGENFACDYLINAGYKILANNWRHQKCELDIVCSFADLIIFVEVKTRSDDYFGKPAEFINTAKQSKLIEGAEAFLEEMNLENEIRFDVIELLYREGKFELNHIENAFHDGL